MRRSGPRIDLDSHIQVAVGPGCSARVAAEDPGSSNCGLGRSPTGNQRCELRWQMHGESFAHSGHKKAALGRLEGVV